MALNSDVDLWASVWAPLLADATSRTHAGDGLLLLAQAVDEGFHQPDLFGDLLETTFGADERWAALNAQMTAPAPRPALELVDWPVSDGVLALLLERQPRGRENDLAARMPEPRPSAWDTAVEVLDWVHTRWVHANEHVTDADALHVLDRAAGG